MAKGSSFRQCPRCKAYNTIHVLRCYKCAADLPHVDSRTIKADRPVPKAALSSSDTRAEERRPLGVIGAMLEVNGEIRHDILIENISAGGLLFHSDFEYFAYDRFGVLIPLEDQHYVVEVDIRRCEALRFTPWRYTLGAEFVRPDAELTKHIRRLCRGAGAHLSYTFS